MANNVQQPKYYYHAKFGAFTPKVHNFFTIWIDYTNYVHREIAAVEFTLKMPFQKVRDELIYCFSDGILDEEEFVLLYDAYKSTNLFIGIGSMMNFCLTR